KKEIALNNMPDIPLKIMMNVANPDRAFSFAALPHKGIGLARLEFIINVMIGVHPKALLNFDRLDPELQAQIRRQTAGYADPVSFYVDKLAEDRKSTRLNSSHVKISYAVFCLKKKTR